MYNRNEDVTPSYGALDNDATLNEALMKATTQSEIGAALHEAKLRLGVLVPDAFGHLTVNTQPTPQKFAKTVEVGGVKHVVESDSEQGLADAEIALFKQIFSDGSTTQRTQQTQQTQPRNERGQFVTPTPVISETEKAALSLQLQLGQITVDQYMEKSGAVADYLAGQGIPLDTLRQVADEKQAAAFERTWQEATAEFLQSDGGADWPGGTQNLKTVSEILKANDLEDQPSVETLTRVYQFMRENDLLVASEDQTRAEFEEKIRTAKDKNEINELLGYRGSSFFGR